MRKLMIGWSAFVALFIGFVAWKLVRLDYDWGKPAQCVVESALGNRVLFLKHGALMSRRISLFVQPKGQAIPIWAGTLTSEDALSFRDACWSDDGSVIACRSLVIGYNETTNVVAGNSAMFVDAYDFKSGQSIGPTRSTVDERTNWIAREEKIEALLRERGGKKEMISADDMTWVRCSYSEWRALTKLEKQPR